MKLAIKKGATVEVISGADKGKKGAVVMADPKNLQLKVQGVKLQTHFDKKDGIKTAEGFIHYSNVKLLEKAPEKKGKKQSKKKS